MSFEIAAIALGGASGAVGALTGGLLTARALTRRLGATPPTQRQMRGSAALQAASRTPGERVVREAFVDARLAGVAAEIGIVSRIEEEGGAWTTVVELPSGVTAAKAIQRRGELASAFGVGPVQLLVLPVPGNNRRVTIWCTDEDPWSESPVASPLVANPRPVDLWDPIPVGLDARGQEVRVPLVFSGVLVGGLPRMGKTVSANNILAAAMLDLNCRIRLADGKGLDSAPIAPLAYQTADEDPETLVDMLAEMTDDMYKRVRRLRSLRLDKLSREVSNDEMPLDLLWIDELAVFTAHPDTKMAKKVTSMLRNLASVGPAVGIIPVLATQRPAVTVVPADLRDLIPTRWAMRCATRHSSDTILGSGATGRGANAAELRPDHKGVGILVGVDDTPVTLRSYLIDVGDLQRIADYAYELRLAAGVKVAPVAVKPSNPERRSLLEDIRSIWPEGEEDLWSEAIVPLLRELDPVAYSDMDVALFGVAMKRAGVPTVQLNRRPPGANKRVNRYGVRRSDLAVRLLEDVRS